MNLEIVATIVGLCVGIISAYITTSRWAKDMKESERRQIEERAVSEINRGRDIAYLQNEVRELKDSINRQFSTLEEAIERTFGQLDQRTRAIEIFAERLNARIERRNEHTKEN